MPTRLLVVGTPPGVERGEGAGSPELIKATRRLHNWAGWLGVPEVDLGSRCIPLIRLSGPVATPPRRPPGIDPAVGPDPDPKVGRWGGVATLQELKFDTAAADILTRVSDPPRLGR